MLAIGAGGPRSFSNFASSCLKRISSSEISPNQPPQKSQNERIGRDVYAAVNQGDFGLVVGGYV
jgi:hypothetical protein